MKRNIIFLIIFLVLSVHIAGQPRVDVGTIPSNQISNKTANFNFPNNGRVGFVMVVFKIDTPTYLDTSTSTTSANSFKAYIVALQEGPTNYVIQNKTGETSWNNVYLKAGYWMLMIDVDNTTACTVTVQMKLTPESLLVPEQDPSLDMEANYYYSNNKQIYNTITTSYPNIKTNNLSFDPSTGIVDIQYFDDLGKLAQTVQVGRTPQKTDLIILYGYDYWGRLSKQWLPIVSPSNNGSFVNADRISEISKTFYLDEESYSRPYYEPSHLNRLEKQYGPGADWHIKKKAHRTGYLTNRTKTGTTWAYADSLVCGLYKTTDDTKSISLFRTTNYGVGELSVTRLKDEDENISYEFKDKKGQVVLTRQINDGKLYDTNYIYDSFGNLRAVLPPEASDRLLSSSSWVETDTNLKLYAYLYKYDGSNHCIAKKLPGCDWIYYVYDKADQLIFTQDGEQRLKSEWTYSIPDVFGRIVLTGTCKNIINYAVENPINAVVKAIYNTSRTNLANSYTITGITLSTSTILSVNYYDDYSFLGMTEVPNNANTQYVAESGYGICYGDHQAANRYKNKGLLTGTVTTQMNSTGGIESTYLYSVMYYDNRGRPIQVKGNNHLPGGIEKEYIAYNFTGQPTQKKHVHQATGKTTQTEVYAYTYDHAGRLTKETYQLNGATAITLAENMYDELGRLKTNKKGGVANALSTYGYNIRSWTKSITSPLFTEILYYNDTYGGSTKQYNGNIGAMSWKLSSETNTHGYAFTYDNLSRLTTSNYLVNGTANTNYKEAYIYDKHGNIATLQRYGKTAASTYGLIDNLTMTYTGNQLLKADDAIATISLSESADFKNYSSVATEYFYNANGAMSKDFNKGITEIQYNSLNLPRQMDIKSPVAEARNEYTYSAGGQKLKVVQKWNPSYSTTPVIGSAINTAALTQTKTTDYVGNKIYENGTLKRILIDGGYIEGGVYHYYLTDHLGNNRVVVNANGTGIQKNHYYPFGTTFAENTVTEQGKQPYKYNGKELDQMHGLNLYDYSARYYESPVGRFTSVDPLAEKYYSESPYAYVSNNPLKYIDPTGKEKLNGMGTRDGGSSIIQARDKVDNDMIHIYGHGSTNGLTFIDIRGNVSVIKNARDLQSLLTRYSAIWNNRLYGEELTIVLHSCNTGDMYNGITLAENISVYMPNVIIAAPSDFLYVSSAGEIIASENKAKYGYWIYYKEGVPIYSEEGNQDNNPDLKHYNRPSYSKGNTKKEQRAKRDEGLNQGQGKPDEYKNWGNQRRWFYDTFGF